MLSTYRDVEKILYVMIALIGVPVNSVAIVILSHGKCGLATCTTRYLVAMAAADLLVIIIDVICYRINRYLFPVNFLDITPVCCSVNVLARTAKNCSVWFTVMFTFDRYVAICCQKLQTKYCTGKTPAFVLPTIGLLLFLKNVPFYFAYNPKEIIDNVPFFCMGKSSYFTHPGWIVFDTIHKIVTPLLPFTIILLLNTLTVRRILVASRARKGLRGQSNGENRSDPEVESRKRSVILLFTISGTFILLWLLHVADFIYVQITGTAFVYTESERIFSLFGVLLSILNCCTNTFIYAVTQSRFRQQLKAALMWPVTPLVQLMRTSTH